VADPGFDLLFAKGCGDDEGLFEDRDGEFAVFVGVAGFDAGLGDLAVGAGENDSLLGG